MKVDRATTTRDLPTVSARDIKRGISIVVYGRSGTGKTTFAATAPGPILYLDVKDEGTDSISDVSDLRIRQCESLADVEETYWWLKKNPKKYKTVIIDTCTQLQTVVVGEVMRKNKRKGEPGAWGSMRKQDWGDVSAVLKEMFLNFRDLTQLGMNVVFIAQDRTFNLPDEEDGGDDSLTPEVGPALSPSVARTLNAMATVVCNTFIRERRIKQEKNGKTVSRDVIEYCVGVGPSSVYTRKIRKPKSRSMPTVIVDCEFDDLLEIVKG